MRLGPPCLQGQSVVPVQGTVRTLWTIRALAVNRQAKPNAGFSEEEEAARRSPMCRMPGQREGQRGSGAVGQRGSVAGASLRGLQVEARRVARRQDLT